MAVPGGATAMLNCAPRAGADPISLVAEMVRLQRRRVQRSACGTALAVADAQHSLLRGSSEWPCDSAPDALPKSLGLARSGAWGPLMSDDLERELLLDLLAGSPSLARAGASDSSAAMRQRNEALVRQAGSLSQASSRYTGKRAFPTHDSIGSQASADSQGPETWVALGTAPRPQASCLSGGASSGLQSFASLEEQSMLDLINSCPALPGLSVGASPALPRHAMALQQPMRLRPEVQFRAAFNMQAQSAEGHSLATRDTNERKVKRLAANREAARRMRKRHSQRLGELEEQVKQLQEANEVTQEELEKATLRIAELECHNARLEQEAEALHALKASLLGSQGMTQPCAAQKRAADDGDNVLSSKRPRTRSFCQDTEASASGSLACQDDALRGLDAAPQQYSLQDCSSPSVLDFTEFDIFGLDA